MQIYNHLILKSCLIESHNIVFIIQRQKEEQIVAYVPRYEEVVLDVFPTVHAQFFSIFRLIQKLLQVMDSPIDRVRQDPRIFVRYLKGDPTDG